MNDLFRKKKWKEPSFILDFVQAVVAFAIGLALALDMLGIWSGQNWLSENIANFTFIAICTLIVTTFLERRMQLEAFVTKTDEKLEQLLRASGSIRLESRSDYRVPFEVRLKNARKIEIIGKNLNSVLSMYEGFIKDKAKSGCKFRLLIADTNTEYAKNNLHTEHAIRLLRSLSEFSPNIHYRFFKYLPPYSLLIIDSDKPDGEVQVELYSYHTSGSNRPHFLITQLSDKKWFDFFVQEFESEWKDSRCDD